MKKVFVTAIAVVLLSTIVSCESTPVIFTIAPTSHNFGQVNIGDTATFDFVITNKKSVDMTLTTVSFTTGEFSEITNAQGKIIPAKATLLITVRFAPSLPGGTKNDVMNVIWTDINGKSGKKDVKLSGEAVPVPLIDLSSTSYNFGTIGIGNNATHNFNIENTGTADLILSLFNFNGNATLFSITAGGVTPVTIIPGATHTVTVQFAPVATGDFPTVLEITHNAVNAIPPASINIDAAGGGGRIEMNQTSPWDFGLGRINFAKIDVVEISNTGSINLNISSITLSTGNVFVIDKIEDSSGNPIAAPFDIAPSDFVEVTIRFTPTAVTTYQDTLSIANDGSYAPSPATLNLKGEGRNPITLTNTYTGNAVNWNVPAGVGGITAEVWGAQGEGGYGGRGARMKGDFAVTPGSTLESYAGGNPGYAAGGQASYVADGSNLLIMAGGGGGSRYSYAAGVNAVIGEDGTRPYQSNSSYTGGAPGTGGQGGQGGRGSWGTGGGGGWLSAGSNASGTQGGAIKGKASVGTQFAGGAAGGYSGGGGCDMDSGWATAGGGGGGSKNNGTNQSNTAGTRTGTGQVQITY